MPRTHPWEVSHELWERVAPLIPQRAVRPKGERPPHLSSTNVLLTQPLLSYQ